MAKKCSNDKLLMYVFWGLDIQLTNMSLDHIIAHETSHFHPTLPFKPAPTCFTKQRETSGTQEIKCIFVCFFRSTN